MKNKELEKLNFEELIRYKVGVPEPKKKYDKPLAWEKLCTSCEDEKKVGNTGIYLEQISHGCDTVDFQHILGALPEPPTGYISEPIMFVAESPGGRLKDNCDEESLKKKTEENGEHCKYPPNLTYYWSPDPEKGWPEDCSNLKYMAGCYFAYLMRRYGFKNVYITNAVKCSMKPNDESQSFITYSSFHLGKKYNQPKYEADIIGRNCIQHYLMKEIGIFQPKIIFTIGSTADKIVRFAANEMKHPKQTKADINWNLPKELMVERLLHYQARRSRKNIVDENNKRIEAKLRELSLWE